MNENYLVTFTSSCSETTGFAIVPGKDWEQIQKDAKNREYPYEQYYGNDYMRFDSEEELMKAFTAKTISDSEIKTMERLFNLSSCRDWGFDPRYFLEEY